MEFKDYQEKALRTAVFTNDGNVVFESSSIEDSSLSYTTNMDFIYPLLGLVGETGEVAEKIKKIIRDKKGILTLEERLELKKELGDVLWYLAVLAATLKLDLNGIAEANLDKLASRKERDKLHGEGDNR
jgi:NTP pyrophosphatase (non-canonical NTP hydrolase)